MYKPGHSLQNPRKSCPRLFFHRFRISHRINHLGEVREVKTKRRTPHGGRAGREGGARPAAPLTPRLCPGSLPGRRPARAAAPNGARRGNGDKAEPVPSPAGGAGGVPPSRSRAVTVADRALHETPKNNLAALSSAPPPPHTHKKKTTHHPTPPPREGAGCQRRCGGTSRPAPPFVVCVTADKKAK